MKTASPTCTGPMFHPMVIRFYSLEPLTEENEELDHLFVEPASIRGAPKRQGPQIGLSEELAFLRPRGSFRVVGHSAISSKSTTHSAGSEMTST